MLKIKKKNITKHDLAKKINSKIGLSNSYINIITDDLILILKNFIKLETVKIKNFGSFKIIRKKERIGRNPKTNETHKINARSAVSFVPSKKFNNKLNNI